MVIISSLSSDSFSRNVNNMIKQLLAVSVVVAITLVVFTGCSGSSEDLAVTTTGTVENLGQTVNSAFNDYAPAVTANGTLFFTSRRPNPKLLDYGDDVYRVNHIGTDWEKPQYLSELVNTPESQGAISITPDGRELYIALCSQPDGFGACDIYVAKWNARGTEWMEARNIDNPEGTRLDVREDNFNQVNTSYWESQPSISPDGKQLYFSSDRPGGYGGTDIWVSTRKEEGTWGAPRNLGPDINTKGDEITPSISFDGRTLFFASDGMPDKGPSAGGFDIYVTRWQGNRWSKPLNLGYPINSAGNDAYIASTLTGDTLYFASDREGGYGGYDLYLMLNPPIPQMPVITVNGVVTDAQTGQPLAGTPVIIEDFGTGETMVKYQSLESGQYQFVLPAGKTYRLSAERNGYLFHSEVFDVPENTLYKRFEKNIALQPIPVKISVPLKTQLTVLFDFDKADLRPESKPELERAIRFIQQNPGKKFEIAAHTDALGTDEYNLDLSERRAAAVRDYLVKHGVPPDIIVAKGYGESQPIADNDTPEGRQLNRRVELKVVDTF